MPNTHLGFRLSGVFLTLVLPFGVISPSPPGIAIGRGSLRTASPQQSPQQPGLEQQGLEQQSPEQQGPEQQGKEDPEAAKGPLREELLEEEALRNSGGATLLMTPSHAEVAAGATIRINLAVLGARDLSRLPVTIRYDGELIELLSVSLGSAWTSRPAPVFMHDASRPGELVVGLAQLGSDLAGISGSAELLELEFRGLRPGDARLELHRFAIIGTGTSSQPAVAQTATIVVR